MEDLAKSLDKASKKRFKYRIIFAVIILLIMPGVVFGAYHGVLALKSALKEPSITENTTNYQKPPYAYNYMEQKCNSGLANLEKVDQKLTSDLKSITSQANGIVNSTGPSNRSGDLNTLLAENKKAYEQGSITREQYMAFQDNAIDVTASQEAADDQVSASARSSASSTLSLYILQNSEMHRKVKAAFDKLEVCTKKVRDQEDFTTSEISDYENIVKNGAGL